MKVILTESQLEHLVCNEIAVGQNMANPQAVYKALIASLMSGKMDKQTALNVAGNLGGTFQTFITRAIRNLFNNNGQEQVQQNTETMDDATFQEKVNAVNEYMTIAAKNQNYNPQNIQLSAEAMVNACNQTGFDLPLLMAQAHLESCFGLTPRARRTNSVFSVGSYDNGVNAKTYPTQNDSIMPYITLMQNNYLGKRGVDDILKPGAFVNGAKKRYASDTNYERKVASIRNKIRKKYPILG
jgi:flagellum-specific peptidoglycan hydrolase FlgJ